MNSPRSFRTTELVKEFARQGHRVTILTPRIEKYHLPFEKEHNVTVKDLGAETWNRLTSPGSGQPVKFFTRALNRALNLFFEYPDIQWMFKVKRALQKESGYDLLISIAAPHPVHWGVAWAWREENPIAGTWVADCGDPFMGTVLDSFNKLFYFRYFEKSFCKKADYITVPIENAKEGYYPEFREKIRVIPQGFNFDAVKIDTETHHKNGIPTFAYAGGLIPGGRDPGELLSYLVSLDNDYKFILYTKSTSLVEPYAEKSGGRIEIRDYIPREQLLKALSRMDFLINFENSTSLQMPSKLIDYYLTGRPVLSVGSRDIDVKTVNRFLQGDYSNRYRFDDVDQYRIEYVCSRFLKLCESGEV